MKQRVSEEAKQAHLNKVAETTAYIAEAGLRIARTRIAIVRDPASDYVGSIIIPEEGKILRTKGTVVGIGEGVLLLAGTDEDPGVEIGDRWMYTKYGGVVMRLDLPSGKEAEVELVNYTDLYIGGF